MKQFEMKSTKRVSGTDEDVTLLYNYIQQKIGINWDAFRKTKSFNPTFWYNGPVGVIPAISPSNKAEGAWLGVTAYVQKNAKFFIEESNELELGEGDVDEEHQPLQDDMRN